MVRKTGICLSCSEQTGLGKFNMCSRCEVLHILKMIRTGEVNNLQKVLINYARRKIVAYRSKSSNKFMLITSEHERKLYKEFIKIKK